MTSPIDQPCPQCRRGDIVQRHNKKTGQPFYGCSHYPDCKFAVADLAKLAPPVLNGAPAAADAPGTLLTPEIVTALRELTLAIASLAEKLGPSSRPYAKKEPALGVQGGRSSSISQEARS